jgi:hypothetical protein
MVCRFGLWPNSNLSPNRIRFVVWSKVPPASETPFPGTTCRDQRRVPVLYLPEEVQRLRTYTGRFAKGGSQRRAGLRRHETPAWVVQTCRMPGRPITGANLAVPSAAHLPPHSDLCLQPSWPRVRSAGGDHANKPQGTTTPSIHPSTEAFCLRHVFVPGNGRSLPETARRSGLGLKPDSVFRR